MPSLASDFVTLTKPRLNFLVLLTTATAYSLGSGPEETRWSFAHTLLGTFLYFHQANIMAVDVPSPGDRTALFAKIDFAVNALTLFCQLFVVGRLVGRFGVGLALPGQRGGFRSEQAEAQSGRSEGADETRK